MIKFASLRDRMPKIPRKDAFLCIKKCVSIPKITEKEYPIK